MQGPAPTEGATEHNDQQKVLQIQRSVLQQAEDLAATKQQFLRDFGVVEVYSSPCGHHPLSASFTQGQLEQSMKNTAGLVAHIQQLHKLLDQHQIAQPAMDSAIAASFNCSMHDTYGSSMCGDANAQGSVHSSSPVALEIAHSQISEMSGWAGRLLNCKWTATRQE